jgi:hypothetical protein
MLGDRGDHGVGIILDKLAHKHIRVLRLDAVRRQ